MSNWNDVPSVDEPRRNAPKDIPRPGTGVGNPGSYPFGPGEVQGPSEGDGHWVKGSARKLSD